jgi:ribosomal protein S6
MQYELFYLVGERQEATLDAIKEKVYGILKTGGATLLDPEVLEKRKLAYEIKHQRKGIYVTRRFELPNAEDIEETKDEKEFGIEAITKKLNLFSDVLRFMIVKTEDLPDLGAKDRRKTQEMSAQKQSFQRPERPQSRPQATVQRKPQPKPVEKKETPEEAKDIDKQLDKLLDI